MLLMEWNLEMYADTQRGTGDNFCVQSSCLQYAHNSLNRRENDQLVLLNWRQQAVLPCH